VPPEERSQRCDGPQLTDVTAVSLIYAASPYFICHSLQIFLNDDDNGNNEAALLAYRFFIVTFRLLTYGVHGPLAYPERGRVRGLNPPAH